MCAAGVLVAVSKILHSGVVQILDVVLNNIRNPAFRTFSVADQVFTILMQNFLCNVVDLNVEFVQGPGLQEPPQRMAIKRRQNPSALASCFFS